MKRVLIGTMAVLALAVFTRTAAADDKADKGAKVFADQKCAMCHSIAGKGNVKGSLDDVGSKLTAAEIREWITDPAGMAAKAKADRKPAMATMAAKYKALPKDDVDNLVAYLSSLKKK
ncbi:MAG TPA: cytochrome c [Vicinamibacterales bacterium]|jgi:mono/diheme cytochrome c family protein|nr:cytochrome c [Vicinamibacterales bacterium]